MIPYDGHFLPLPLDPITVMKGFVSITAHPDPQHHHSDYKINLTDDQLLRMLNQHIAKRIVQPKPSGSVAKKTGGVSADVLPFCLSSIVLPVH